MARLMTRVQGRWKRSPVHLPQQVTRRWRGGKDREDHSGVDGAQVVGREDAGSLRWQLLDPAGARSHDEPNGDAREEVAQGVETAPPGTRRLDPAALVLVQQGFRIAQADLDVRPLRRGLARVHALPQQVAHRLDAGYGLFLQAQAEAPLQVQRQLDPLQGVRIQVEPEVGVRRDPTALEALPEPGPEPVGDGGLEELAVLRRQVLGRGEAGLGLVGGAMRGEDVEALPQQMAAQLAEPLSRWRSAMVDRLLAAYADAAAVSTSFPGPRPAADLLRLFTWEKALYEIRYELASRPG